MVIKKIGKVYFVFSKEGKRLSKGFSTKSAAQKRLREIEFFKSQDITMKRKNHDAFDLSSFDFEIDENNIIIYNVPIAVEMVQRYDDGFAFKSFDEISKIDVDNVPLTIMSEMPSHPRGEDGSVKHLGEMDTKERSKFVTGFMTNPSKPKNDQKKKRKKYADFVVPRIPKTKALEQKLQNKEAVDVSIGFSYEHENENGDFFGQKYDYIQKNIQLDHTAILIDEFGHVGIGRAPSPLAGIGADQSIEGTKSIKPVIGRQKMSKEDSKMSDNEIKKKYDELEKENSELKEQVAESETKLESTEKKLEESEAKTKELEEEKTEAAESLESARSEDSDLRKTIDSLKNELKEYREERKVKVDSARSYLIQKYPEMQVSFDSLTDKQLLKQYDSLVSNSSDKKSFDLGADMKGPKENHKKVDEAYQMKAFSNYTSGKDQGGKQ